MVAEDSGLTTNTRSIRAISIDSNLQDLTFDRSESGKRGKGIKQLYIKVSADAASQHGGRVIDG